MRCSSPLLLLALILASHPAQAQDDDALWGETAWTEDANEGRRFRVHFDPATRVALGAYAAFTGSDHRSWSIEAAFSAGFEYRLFLDFVDDHGIELVSWQMDHEALSGIVHPWRIGLFGFPVMDATAFSANYLRHTREPFIVIPSTPPKRFFFPFDIGVEAEMGRLRVTEAAPSSPSRLQIGAIRGLLLLDAWRSGEQGRTLELGIGLRYDLEVLAASVLHRVSPFTSVSLRFRYQSDDGRTLLDLEGTLSPHLEVSLNEWMVEAEVVARLERVLISINDEPISLRFDAGYERLPPMVSGGAGQHQFKTTLGLLFAFQLR